MIPNVFIQNAADILAATNGGLSTSQVVKLCAAYAIDFNVEIPYCYPKFRITTFIQTKILSQLDFLLY